LTNLAIIGTGIVGRSLIYSLAKQKKSLSKITLFSADHFLSPCTFNSTAIVAPRGITEGHSALGDSLLDGFQFFTKHFENDHPRGIEKITQLTGASIGIENFRKRYPHAHLDSTYLKENIFLAKDEAYMIDPYQYMDWLLEESEKNLNLELVHDLVIGVEEGRQITLKTQKGTSSSFEQVIFAGGNYNRFWASLLPESKLKTSKPVQGSYYEFHDVDWNISSFSLTLDGDNIVWNAPLKRLFLGSTTNSKTHLLPEVRSLESIYQRLTTKVALKLPPIESGTIKTGLREKAQKREPYVIQKENLWFIGGLYKNAFTLSLKMASDLTRQFL